MARAIGTLPPGATVVELGPGTGALTEELTRAFPEARFVLVERDPEFVRLLRARFPETTVIQGDAAALEQLLGGGTRPASIVSGLPMLSLPVTTRNAIFSALERVMAPGARFIQFTYGPSAWKRMDLKGFRRVALHRVWGNVPPAAVLTFERK